MLIVKVQKGNLNRALKQFKRKFKNTKVLKEIRERKHYVKPSLKRRIEKDEAIRKLKKQHLKKTEHGLFGKFHHTVSMIVLKKVGKTFQ